MFKQACSLLLGCVAVASFGIIPPAFASEYSPEEAEALENNLGILCDTPFEELEDMGISFNETGEEYLDVACDAVVDGIDENDYSDAEFEAAIDFLAESLAAVNYE